MEWYYESDGGCVVDKTYQPKTHYITNGWDREDFDTKKEALEALAKK